jgi:Membrane bound beta barrel domain (DUF5777)
MIRRLALVLTFVLAATSIAAQDRYTPVGKLPLGDTLLSLPSSQIPSQGTWEWKFTHRFNQPLTEGGLSDQVHSFFGLDTNADVVFGFSYALRRDLQFSVHRSNSNDTLEGAVKYVVLQQAPAVPLTLTLRGGADWRTESDLEDRVSLFAQVIASRKIGNKLEVFALPTFATKAGRAASGTTSAAMFDHAFNVPVGVAFMIRRPLALVLEVIPPNGDLPDSMNGDFGWSFGIKRAIGGHWFEILLTNNQSTFVDQYVTTTFQGAPLDAGDVRLGFNIERRFGRTR